MYLTIQKKANHIMILTFFIAAALIYGIYQLIAFKTNLGIIGIVLCFACVAVLVYLFLSILIKNLEKIVIFKMLDKKQIALAKIKSGSFYQTAGDLFFRKHEIYSFEAEIYTQNGETKNITIYEDVKNTTFPAFPMYVYVTYNGKNNKIGIVPTFYISLKPKLKEIVQKYEEQYRPRYVEVLKHNGLTLKKFKL